ncbi:hypothetical protein CLV51_101737 [Chitinophaga niastensis]|uniref:Uncharacterized protein n=1 Tax=Chitinophaga niastensis TaxID=536980 RepID=A0A2P8HT82_CHINA|nr:hypothetical protein CLV51_101737 [Chitinophaga niastensis]
MKKTDVQHSAIKKLSLNKEIVSKADSRTIGNVSPNRDSSTRTAGPTSISSPTTSVMM